MRKFRRLILIAGGSVIGLVAIVLLGVNLYVQSQATQAKIQQELSQRLNMPLQIRQISVTPWGGLKLSGITIPQVPARGASEFLKANTFRLRIRFLSLFAQRLVIKEVSLIDPTVVWPQNSQGKWRLPESRESEGVAAEPDGTQLRNSLRTEQSAEPGTEADPASSVALERAQAEPLARKTASTSAEKIRIPVVPELQRVNVKRGEFTFLDQAGSLVADFHRVDFRSDLGSASSIRGNAKIAKISLRDRFFLEALQSPFNYEPDVLELSKISAHAGGGKLTGYFAMQPEADGSPFAVTMRFLDVQADRIVTDAGGQKGTVQGKLSGNLHASGKTADPNALTGSGEIFLQDGQLRQYSLLVALGQLLQIEELTQLRLDQAEAKYHISAGSITVDELVLRSPNIRLSATGTVNFDGRLQLDSQLAINDKIRGQLFKPIAANFRSLAEAGYYGLNFQVGGTVDRPRTNLVDRLVGRELKDFVSGLLGGGRPKKKKPAVSATPAEDITATPSSEPQP